MRKSLCLLGLLGVLSLGAAGCNKEGDCEKVVDHVIALMQKEIPDEMKDQAAAERAKLLDSCREQKPTKAQEECALRATTLSGVLECDAQ